MTMRERAFGSFASSPENKMSRAPVDDVLGMAGAATTRHNPACEFQFRRHPEYPTHVARHRRRKRAQGAQSSEGTSTARDTGA